MAKRFGGTINVDIRDSEPDWAPFEPPRAPDGAPNVVYIVLDDVRFSAMSCYGGPIETPNIGSRSGSPGRRGAGRRGSPPPGGTHRRRWRQHGLARRGTAGRPGPPGRPGA